MSILASVSSGSRLQQDCSAGPKHGLQTRATHSRPSVAFPNNVFPVLWYSDSGENYSSTRKCEVLTNLLAGGGAGAEAAKRKRGCCIASEPPFQSRSTVLMTRAHYAIRDKVHRQGGKYRPKAGMRSSVCRP